MSDYLEDDFRDNPVELDDTGKWQNVPTVDPLPQPQRPRPNQPQKQAPARPQHRVTADSIAQQYANPASPDYNDEDEDYSEVLNDASLRLEQGQLYQMIMNHDLFNGTTADPKAVKAVQRQIRKFAKEQMEIMLGMKAPSEAVQHVEVQSPFNTLEVRLLKDLASKMSQGKTSTPEADKIATGLNTIGSVAKKQMAPKPLMPSAQKPIPRAAAPAAPKTPAGKSAILEENYKPLEKDPGLMTPEELIERNREISARRTKRPVATGGIAMPTVEQEEMLHTQRAMAVMNPSNPLSAIISKISQQR